MTVTDMDLHISRKEWLMERIHLSAVDLRDWRRQLATDSEAAVPFNVLAYDRVQIEESERQLRYYTEILQGLPPSRNDSQSEVNDAIRSDGNRGVYSWRSRNLRCACI